MTFPITHTANNCYNKLGSFDEKGRLLDNHGNIVKVENVVAVFSVVLLCGKCGRYYLFDGKKMIKKQARAAG